MLYSLPLVLEQNFADYIRANYNGSYNVNQAWTTADYVAPIIVVKAGELKETIQQSSVFEAKVTFAIKTQVDDPTDPATTHDNTTATIYGLITNQEAVYSALNLPDGNLHVYDYWISSYDQERQERQWVSLITITLHCQTLPSAVQPFILP